VRREKEKTVKEDEIKRLLEEKLRREGFRRIEIRYGHEHGIDIEATFPNDPRHLIIEAKGEPGGKNKDMDRQIKLGEALYQILSNYGKYAIYAVALPDNPGYRKLVSKIPDIARQKLELHFLLISKEAIKHLAPDKHWPSSISDAKTLKDELLR